MGENYIKMIDNNNELTFQFQFEIAKQCSLYIVNNDLENARKLAIHMLEKSKVLSKKLYEFWDDIIESLGFYPYLKAKSLSRLDYDIRKCYYESSYLPNIYLHASQKKISEMIFNHENIVLSAPTSFGKSLLIEEIVASEKFDNIVIIQPTLALLDETRLKLLKYEKNYRLIVRTTQEFNRKGKNIFLLTAERVLEYSEFPKIDFLIIDEFYKISYSRDDERVDVLNNAFLRLYKLYRPQFYFLGPNIPSISNNFTNEFNAKFIYTNYNLVDTIVFDYQKINKEKNKNKILFKLLDNFYCKEQSLVYCSSPNVARKLALMYYEHLSIDNNYKAKNENLPLVSWIKAEISKKWSLSNELSYGIAIHDASLPKHLGSSIIRYFNNHKLDVIFCTPTIIEGVNTSAKNVIIYSDRKGNKKIDYFDYCNIKGRAGRLMEHYVGNVYNLISRPNSSEIQIDIPFIDQKNVRPEVLINIPREKVKPGLMAEYDRLHQIPSSLMNILKKNGVNIKKQLELLKRINILFNKGNYILLWKQIPNWDQLSQTISLLFECQLLRSDHRVQSAKQLSFFLERYFTYRNIIRFFKELLHKEKNDDTYDKDLEDAFYIQRRWFQYEVPKKLRVCEALVNYACCQKGIGQCSYSFYAQQLETNFLPNNLSLLLEYGIPTSTIRKLEKYVPKDINEESLLQFIKNENSLDKLLMPYELELLHNNL